VNLYDKDHKPNGTIDTFSYDMHQNLVETIRIKPNGKRKLIKTDQIIRQRFDLSNIENNTLEFKEENGNRKTRTVFKFDSRKNIIRNEGYMQLKGKDGIFGKEFKVFTTINVIEYKN